MNPLKTSPGEPLTPPPALSPAAAEGAKPETNGELHADESAAGAEPPPPFVATSEQRLHEVVKALGWADDELLHWLGQQDPARVPEVHWLLPILRELLYAGKLGSLYGPCDLEGLDADFWRWFRKQLRDGSAEVDWFPPPVREHYCRRRWQDFLAEQRDPTQPPHRLFHDVEDDFWHWMLTEGCRRHPELQRTLPGLVDPSISERFVGTSGDDALREGFLTYKTLKKAFERYVGPIQSSAGILDFGAGWGRILRFFLKDLEGGKLWGVDPYFVSVDACRRTNRWCRFAQIECLPPTDFADGTFDLIYLYSVFSHLSEPAHQRWLTEFHRILRPGGLVIATTWPRSFIPWCAKVRDDPDEPCEALWRDMIGRIFLDIDKALADYDAGRFCFGEFDRAKWPSFECEGINSYGDACIPRGYVEEHWADRFTLLEFLDDSTRYAQNFIIARRT